jgi:hypothetical protein
MPAYLHQPMDMADVIHIFSFHFEADLVLLVLERVKHSNALLSLKKLIDLHTVMLRKIKQLLTL